MNFNLDSIYADRDALKASLAIATNSARVARLQRAIRDLDELIGDILFG